MTLIFINGWPNVMRSGSCVLLLLICLLPLTGWAREEQPVDPELLEFLGTFVTAKGNEIDPLQLRQTGTPGKQPLRSHARQEPGKVKQRTVVPGRSAIEEDTYHEN